MRSLRHIEYDNIRLRKTAVSLLHRFFVPLREHLVIITDNTHIGNGFRYGEVTAFSQPSLLYRKSTDKCIADMLFLISVLIALIYYNRVRGDMRTLYHFFAVVQKHTRQKYFGLVQKFSSLISKCHIILLL